MPDNTLVFPAGFRLLDADGNVVSGGSVEFFNAGTSNARTVYSDSGLSTSLGSVVYLDSGGYPVSASGGSNKVSVYTGTSAYKVIVKTSAAATLATIDNIAGALDTSTFAVASAAPERPVVSRSDTSWTVGNTSADAGKIYKSNPNSGSQTVTLPSAVTVGDGFTFTLVHDGGTSSNTVTWQTVSSQTVDINGVTRTAGALIRDGETITFVSDGANWLATEYKHGGISTRMAQFAVADRLSTPPTSPTPGARYIVTSSPTGDWSTYSQHDVLEANGVGGWVRHIPWTDCGWTAYVQDEDINYQYRGTSWVALSGEAGNQTSTIKRIVVADVKAQGTVGGTPSTNAWTVHTLNTTIENDITGASLSSDRITLPAGSYLVYAYMTANRTASTQIRLKSTTTSTAIVSPQASFASTDAVAGLVSFADILELSAQEIFELQYYVTNSAGTDGLGIARNVSGETEVYAKVVIVDATTLAGANGQQGPQGPSLGIDYAFDSATTDADPGSGELRFNNATLASVTNVYISKTGRNSESFGTYIGTWDDTGTSANRSTLLVKDINSNAILLATITGNLTDATTYWKVPVTIRASNGTFTAGDILAVIALPTGDAGTIGGSTGGTGNRVLASSGTGGSTLQATGIDAGSSLNDVNHSGRTVRPWVGITPSNGTNNDFTVPEGTNFRVTGPTNDFTFTGLTGGVDGREIVIYNTVGFAMTLANDSASSTAANRIVTLTGANVATTTQGAVRLVYDGTASRWILVSVQS